MIRPLILAMTVSAVLVGCGDHQSRYTDFSADGLAKPTRRSLTDAESLQLEVQQGDLSKLQTRIAAGLPVDHRLPSGRTLLMEAVVWSKADVIAYLLAQGADASTKDAEGRTARDLAEGKPELLRLFPQVLDPVLIAEVFRLAESGDYRKLKARLDEGLDVNMRNDAGDMLLIVGVRVSSRGVVAMLSRYVGIDFDLRDGSGLTALAIARQIGNQTIVRELEARGAKE
mgnify:CR=1 FL=1